MKESLVGCHVSIAGSIERCFDNAEKVGCSSFQIFTKNPRGWRVKELNPISITKFRAKLKHFKNPIIAHISYLPNLASQNQEMYSKSVQSFLMEIERCVQLGISYFVIHSGSYKGGTKEKGIQTYVNSILRGIEVSDGKIIILIENSSGEKNTLTGNFKTIQKIVEEIDSPKLVQVCVDTCHTFAAGYDLREEKTVASTLDEIDATIGINNVPVIHINDSKGEIGSHADKHEHLGLGKIGEEGIKSLINSDVLRKKIWILETPINEIRDDKENIKYFKKLKERN